MSRHIYLIKDNDDLVSHCQCQRAAVTFPPQMDCPWCGCGWLFTCIDCRKAFSFAKAVEVDESWEDLGRRDLKNRWKGSEVDEEELGDWVGAMQEMLADVEVGQRYVYLDGYFLPAELTDFEVEGWHSLHSFDLMPHVEALDDISVIDQILGNQEYWYETALEEE